MKLTIKRAPTLVALGVIGAINGVQAAPVYEILNIDELYDLHGTIEGTRNGYGVGVNTNDLAVSIALGRKKIVIDDDNNSVIDIEDGLSPAEKVSYSINEPIIANNFTFISEGSGWQPTFDSLNGTTPPNLLDPDADVNSVDSYYYGLNDAGLKVGAVTAVEQTMIYDGSNEDQEFWYYREFEQRAIVKDSAGTETLIAPPYTEYVDGDNSVTVGGLSVAAAVNQQGVIAGAASIELTKSATDKIKGCFNAEQELPLDICVQNLQYPNSSGVRHIQYQIRGYVWRIEAGQVKAKELPLGLDVADSSYNFFAQGLGINEQAQVVGVSHVYRHGNRDKLYQDAAFWNESEGEYEYHWVPMEDDVRSSTAYDINDNGILVGSQYLYIKGYLRDKFFYFDTNNPDGEIVVPNDFYTERSDLSSKPRSINNYGLVVGNIETAHDKERPRPKEAFLYDLNSDEFKNLNTIMTCESKGYVRNGDDWERNIVKVSDGTGKELSYDSEIKVVEANSINDDGTIVGTAFIRKPSYQLDAAGEPVYENGELVFELNGNGQPVTSFVPRMVVLKPAADGVACDAVEQDDTGNEKFVRQGAASLLWLLLIPLFVRRWYLRK